jgi:microcystin-dependent protein
VGQIVFVAAGDYMSVQGVNTTNNTLTLRNMGLLGTAAGTNIPVGSTVSGTGPQGPQGVAGPQGPAGPQGLIGVAPTGAIYMWPAVTAPGGYLFCQGQLVSRSTYSALFSIIATTYNYGTPDEDSTNFRLPNFQGRVPLGAGQATAVPPSQPAAPAGATNHGLASAGGEETHLLITGELAAHLHPITDLQHTHPDPQHSHTGYTSTHSHTGHDTGHTHPAAAPQAIGYGQAGGPMYQAVSGNTGVGYAQIAIDAAAALTVQTYNAASNLGAQYTGITGTQSTGNNQPHNTMMPYLTVNYIIKT